MNNNYPLALYTSLGLAGLGLAVFGNGIQYVGGSVLALASGGAVYQKLKETNQGPGAAVESLGLVGVDLWQGAIALVGQETSQQVGRLIYTHLPDLGFHVEPEDPNGFISEARALRSKWIIGPKGSLKSRLATYLNTRILQAAPNTALIIADPHYPASGIPWLPGIAAEHFEAFHLKREPADIYQAVLAMEAKLQQRITAAETTQNPVHMVVDEFVSIYKGLSDRQQERLVTAIQAIQYQGRKYGVDITCILHSAKKEQCGLDSSLFINGDCYLMGTAAADRLQQQNLPSDINWKKLLSDREGMVTQAKNPKQVIIYRDQDTGLSSVEQLPAPVVDFSGKATVQLEYRADNPAQWITDNRDRLEQWLITEGLSPSAISHKGLIQRPDGKGLFRGKGDVNGYADPYYAALVEFANTLKEKEFSHG